VKQLISLLVIISIVYLSSLNWRRAIKAVLVVSVLEGAIRKWFLPEASDLIYFLKDIILVTAYVHCFAAKIIKSTPK